MGNTFFNKPDDNSTSIGGGVDKLLYKYRLKSLLAGILLIMSIFFLHYGGRGEIIEYIMIGITAFLVGGAVYNKD